MEKSKIMIVDTDFDYIIPLQAKFVEEFFDNIDLEIITDINYFNHKFLNQQKLNILIISERLYTESLLNHEINQIFIMSEQHESTSDTQRLNVSSIYKYTSVKDIFTEIVGKTQNIIIHSKTKNQNNPKIIAFYSGAGGVGKTTLSLMLSNCLSKQWYKKVLYINAGYIQNFQRLLKNQGSIIDMQVYSKLANPHAQIYSEIKHVIREEGFYYLPPFRGPLMSLGLSYSIYGDIAKSAKSTNQFDFIVLDLDSCFNEENAILMNMADYVVIVTTQDEASAYATRLVVNNINGMNTEKYSIVCNKFDKSKTNYLLSNSQYFSLSVTEYVEKIENSNNINDFNQGIRNLSSLLV